MNASLKPAKDLTLNSPEWRKILDEKSDRMPEVGWFLVAGTVESYLHQIVMSLQRKTADYKEAGDEERKEAAEDLLVPLKSLCAQARSKNYKVPASGNINLAVELPYASL